MKISMTNGTRYDGLDDLLRDHEGATGMDASNFFVDLLDAEAVAAALLDGRVLVYAEDHDASGDDAIGDIEQEHWCHGCGDTHPESTMALLSDGWYCKGCDSANTDEE